MAIRLQHEKHVMYWARVALLASVALGANGCTNDVTVPPGADGGNMGGTVVPMGGAGLEFIFRSQPDPISIEGDGGPFEVTIANASFVLRNVRAVGESATGDDRTSRDEMLLVWPRKDTDQTYLLEFPDAPVGIYSYLLAQVKQYDIRGTVVVEGRRYEFAVADELNQTLSLMIDLHQLALPIKEVMRVEVKVDLCRPICDLPWDTVDRGGSELSIGGGPLLQQVRDKVIGSFTATVKS